MNGVFFRVTISCALIPILFWLATNAFVASQCIDSEPIGCSMVNLYVSEPVIEDEKLNIEIDNRSKALEFMVWEHERGNLSRELRGLVRQRINLDPFNRALWLQLAYLQKETGITSDNRAWTLERAAKLSNWNLEERSKISRYCIDEYTEFRHVSARLCSSLIAKLPSRWSDQFKAQKMNVSLSKFQAVLQAEEKSNDAKGLE